MDMGLVLLAITRVERWNERSTDKAGRRSIILSGVYARSASSAVRPDTFTNQILARGVKAITASKTVTVDPSVTAKLRSEG
jgi:hypothetical protein